MRSLHKTNPLAMLTLLSLITGLTACGGGGGDTPAVITPPAPATTTVGVIDNSLIGSGKTIGAAGDTLSTLDNKLTLTVPAGALTADTPITIMRITNTAHGGVGGGFRLVPDGLTFNQPVTLTFSYTDEDLAGSDPQILGAAFQTAAGYWQWLGTPVIDELNKTISITTTHFTDFSLVQGYQLLPLSKSVRVSQSQAMQVMFCFTQSVAEDDLQPLAYACENSGPQADLVPLGRISEWSVNGVIGGNSTVGTISGNGSAATYTAPANKPSPATVAVSAKINQGGRGYSLVVSNITITDESQYAGTVNFSTNVTEGINASYGVANVTWTLIEDLPDVRTYSASGTISADLRPVVEGYTCAPVAASGSLNTSDELLVYTASSTIFSMTHAYTLNVSDLNTQLSSICTSTTDSNDTFEYLFSKLLYVHVGGNCYPSMTPQPVAFTDEANLAGNYNCPGATNFSGTNASWSFVAQ